jgi:hypothetical protein
VDALAVKAEEGRETATKVVGEAPKACDPAVSEWGNPPSESEGDPDVRRGGEPSELKHLSKRRKRYSLSSGERKGRSLNLPCASHKSEK